MTFAVTQGGGTIWQLGTVAGTNAVQATLNGGTLPPLIFNATGGGASEPFAILTSTNLLLPAAQWTTVTTGNFDGSGNLTS